MSNLYFTLAIFLCTNSCTLSASINSLAEKESLSTVTPDPLNVVFTDISTDTATMSWQRPSESIDHFTITFALGSEAPDSCDNTNSQSVSGTSFSFSNLNPDSTYSYRLCSTSPDGSKKSAGITGLLNTLKALTRTPIYPSFKNWNQYLNNDGTDILTASGVTCSNLYQGYFKCLHGGQLFKATLSPGVTCAQVKVYDTLDVFVWRCNDSVSPPYVYSSGIKKGKGLQHLISDQGFIKNRIIVEVNNSKAYLSQEEVWWDNPVEILPSSASGTTTSLTNGSSSVGKIFYVKDQQTGGSYSIDANGISIVVLPSGKLTLSATATPLIKAGTIAAPRKNLWIEGAFESGSIPSLQFEGLSMSRINLVKASNSEIKASNDNYIYQLNHIGSFSTYNSMVLTIENGFFWNSTSFPIDLTNSALFKMIGVSIIGGGTSGIGGSMGYLPTNSVVRNVTIANSYRNSLHVVTTSGASNRTLLHNFLSSNAGQIYQWRAGGNTFSNIMLGSMQSTDLLINITGLNGAASRFTNHMVLTHANCYEAGNSFSPGFTNGTCVPAGSSDATLTVGFDLNKLFVGAITSDDIQNASDTAGVSLFDSILDWFQFETSFRLWGRKDDISHTDIVGPCLTTDDCQIWDLRIKADTNNSAFNRTELVTSQNQPFIPGNSCPTAVSGNKVTTFDFGSGLQTFLTNAHEILDDGIGDEDTLCESNESCIYNPNFGAYQGEGDYYTNGTCSFNDGTVSGVKMYSYPIIGI